MVEIDCNFLKKSDINYKAICPREFELFKLLRTNGSAYDLFRGCRKLL